MENVLAQAAVCRAGASHTRRTQCMAAAVARADGDEDPDSDTTRDVRATFAGLVALRKTHNMFSREVRELQLMFYSPPADDDIRNRLVAWATALPTYTNDGERDLYRVAHVELSFPTMIDGSRFASGRTGAFSIVQNSKVFFRDKRWRAGYSGVTFLVDSERYARLFMRCVELAGSAIPFDAFGMYASHFAPRALLEKRGRHTHGTFCSRIITEVIQEAEVCPERFASLVPATTTPCRLYMAVRSHGIVQGRETGQPPAKVHSGAVFAQK